MNEQPTEQQPEQQPEQPPRKHECMVGDCEECGHSIIYHAPLVGCLKCDCDEFS